MYFEITWAWPNKKGHAAPIIASGRNLWSGILYISSMASCTHYGGFKVLKSSLDRGEGVPIFRWDDSCSFGGVDFDDPTTNMHDFAP